METASGKETIILRRLIAYSEKIFQFSKGIVTLVSDRREKPRISTAAVVKSSLVLFWARLGSSNAWEQVGRARFWQRWLGEPAFSADTLGRVHALLDANGLRQGIHDVYEHLKRSLAGYLRPGRSSSGRSRKPRQLHASLFQLFATHHPRCGRRSRPLLSSAGHAALLALMLPCRRA